MLLILFPFPSWIQAKQVTFSILIPLPGFCEVTASDKIVFLFLSPELVNDGLRIVILPLWKSPIAPPTFKCNLSVLTPAEVTTLYEAGLDEEDPEVGEIRAQLKGRIEIQGRVKLN